MHHLQQLCLLLAALIPAAYSSNFAQSCVSSACSPRNIEADFVILIDISKALPQDTTTQNAIRNFLSNFTFGLTLSPDDSQVAIYTYSGVTTGYTTLTQGSNATVVQNAIANLKFDGTSERNLFQALTREEAEVSTQSGWRPNYKHVLIVTSADVWTGTNVIGSSLLSQVQSRYDVVLGLGYGQTAVTALAPTLYKLSGKQSNAFFAYNFDQLPYAAQWLYNFGCPGVQQSTLPPTTTLAPTQNPSVPCQLSSLNYDVYIIVDTSAQISASDFAALKQTLVSFVNPFPIGDGKTQFALVANSVDSELYYTGFHAGQDRGYVLDTINQLLQDGSNGQSLKLSLQAIQGAYLNQRYPTNNKLIVYWTGNTNWDADPNQLMNQLKSNYTVSAAAVQWTSGADVNQLNNLVGGSKCVNQATNRANAAVWLQTLMCGGSGNCLKVMRDAERMTNGVFESNQSRAYYYRGRGQLTDNGIRQALTLGRELRAQLVQQPTQFTSPNSTNSTNSSSSRLSAQMIPSQAYFQSFIFERNLMTLGAVGNALFDGIDGASIPIPIVTGQIADDYLTAPQCDCPWYLNEVNLFLSVPPGATQNLTSIAKSMYYIGRTLEIAIQNKTIINTLERAQQSEALHEQYVKYAMLSGVGPFHKQLWIRQRTGYLLYTILESMRKRVYCIDGELANNQTDCAVMKNLYAYSVHDTMILTLLDSMNLLNVTLAPNRSAPALAAIFFELWDRNESYYVRVRFRQTQQAAAISVTQYVPGCEGSEYCEIFQFYNCCTPYTTSTPAEDCWGDTQGDWTTDGSVQVTYWSFSVLTWIFLGTTVLLAILVVSLLICIFCSAS